MTVINHAYFCYLRWLVYPTMVFSHSGLLKINYNSVTVLPHGFLLINVNEILLKEINFQLLHNLMLMIMQITLSVKQWPVVFCAFNSACSWTVKGVAFGLFARKPLSSSCKAWRYPERERLLCPSLFTDFSTLGCFTLRVLVPQRLQRHVSGSSYGLLFSQEENPIWTGEKSQAGAQRRRFFFYDL